MALGDISLSALADLPEFRPGDDLGAILAERLGGAAPFADGDVLVIAQKIVSKAEGRLRDLAAIEPSEDARALARRVQKDPRLVQAILDESRAVIRAEPGVLIVEHRLGFIMANAGIDQSNVAQHGEGTLLLLPENADDSAARVRQCLAARLGSAPGVVISDSFGRPWREGVCGVAIGVAGLPALLDQRGTPDRFGRSLRVTTVAHADQLAAAASILMGQGAEGRPAVLVRGAAVEGAGVGGAAGSARDLIRPARQDLFR